MKQNNLVSTFAIFIGAFLGLEGLQELFRPVVFGVLATNPLHGAIHIVLGLIGIVTGLRCCARGFCIFLGALLVAVALLWFIPATNGLIVRILNVNQPVAILNVVVGLLSLAIALASSRTTTTDR